MKITSELLTQLRDNTIFEIETLISYYTDTDPVRYADIILGLKEALDVVTNNFDTYI